MLDEIYCEQFEKAVRPILLKRKEGYEALKVKVLKSELSKSPMKDVMKKLGDAYKAVKDVKDYMEENGLRLNNSLYEQELTIDSYRYLPNPTLSKYNDETNEIEQSLAKKKKEIRARIYGMDTTFEEVEREISKEIASIR